MWKQGEILTIFDIAAPAMVPATAVTDMINNILPDKDRTNIECKVEKSMKILRIFFMFFRCLPLLTRVHSPLLR